MSSLEPTPKNEGYLSLHFPKFHIIIWYWITINDACMLGVPRQPLVCHDNEWCATATTGVPLQPVMYWCQLIYLFAFWKTVILNEFSVATIFVLGNFIELVHLLSRLIVFNNRYTSLCVALLMWTQVHIFMSAIHYICELPFLLRLHKTYEDINIKKLFASNNLSKLRPQLQLFFSVSD